MVEAGLEFPLWASCGGSSPTVTALGTGGLDVVVSRLELWASLV